MDLSENRKAQIEALPHDIKIKLLKKLGKCKYGDTFVLRTRVSLNFFIDFHQTMADENIDEASTLLRKTITDFQDKLKNSH